MHNTADCQFSRPISAVSPALADYKSSMQSSGTECHEEQTTFITDVPVHIKKSRVCMWCRFTNWTWRCLYLQTILTYTYFRFGRSPSWNLVSVEVGHCRSNVYRLGWPWKHSIWNFVPVIVQFGAIFTSGLDGYTVTYGIWVTLNA